MSKNAVLVTSLVSIIFVIIVNVLPSGKPPSILFWSNIIITILTFVLWIAVTYTVFKDAKEHNRNPAIAGLALLFGGVAGLVYYAVTYKEGNK